MHENAGTDSKSAHGASDGKEDRTVQLSKRHFIRIHDGDTVHYGGNQAWYAPNQIGMKAGCGPTTAANILAYLAIIKSDCRKLYGYNTKRISKKEFLSHMKEVFEYVTPISVPGPINDFIYEKAGVLATWGIPFLGKLALGMESFARDRGVALCVHRLSGNSTLEEATGFIEEGLRNDSPIAMLNYLNLNLAKVPFTNARGEKYDQDFQMHWVTITAIHRCGDSGRIDIDVSSWGGKASFNLNEVVCSVGFGGLLYWSAKER